VLRSDHWAVRVSVVPRESHSSGRGRNCNSSFALSFAAPRSRVANTPHRDRKRRSPRLRTPRAAAARRRPARKPAAKPAGARDRHRRYCRRPARIRGRRPSPSRRPRMHPAPHALAVADHRDLPPADLLTHVTVLAEPGARPVKEAIAQSDDGNARRHQCGVFEFGIAA